MVGKVLTKHAWSPVCPPASHKMGMVVNTCEMGAGGSALQGHPQLHRTFWPELYETGVLKKKKNNKNKKMGAGRSGYLWEAGSQMILFSLSLSIFFT